MPSSAYIDLGSMSSKYILYSDDDYAHKFIYIHEWASIKQDEELVALLRILVSEGRVVHGTVDINRKPQRIEKDGPTGLLMTTTDASLDYELETRCLSVVTDDSPEQTGRVFEALANLEGQDETPVDFTPWRDLQEWIAFHGETRVVIPFIHALAKAMPRVAPRLRRDFVTLQCLIRAHAILHQATRERDDRGRIIATTDDYTRVSDLISALIAESVDASVSSAMRATVEAVDDIVKGPGVDHATVKQLIDRLGIGQSATYDRVYRALRTGYLVNLAKKDERGMKLAVGAAMPGSEAFLPSAEDLLRVYSGTAPGTANEHEQTHSEVSSGIPGLPATPTENGGSPSPEETGSDAQGPPLTPEQEAAVDAYFPDTRGDRGQG